MLSTPLPISMTDKLKSNMYLNSINIYRGIAILLIVSAHCYSISEIKIDTTAEAVFANLTAGSTIHFIFISGFLFHHIFYRKEKIRIFFLGKIKRLLIPYTVLSILPIILKLKTEPEFWNTYFNLNGNGLFNDYIIPAILYYLTGAHLVAYWYIPFAICLFLMYPFHVKFIETKSRNQFIIITFLYIVALFVHRPFDELNVVQSVVYFTPPYLLGILCSINKDFIYLKLRNNEFVLFALVLALAVFQAFLGRHDNYQKEAFVFDGIDLILLQKSFFCIFFMVFLKRFEHVKNKFLTLLASTSFAIYFLHGYVLQVLTLLKRQFEFMIQYNWAVYFSIWAILIMSCILLALFLKTLSPKFSQYISGY
jgi:peptidoglycan/LPS O-acetylase OafA/YrhL